MAEKKTETAKGANKYPVEKLQVEMRVTNAVHTGICIQMGWHKGKEVSKEEYTAAIKQFKSSAAGRRKNA